MPATATRAVDQRVLELCELSGAELDRRFRESGAGRVPDGPVVGAMMVLPGTPVARPIARAVRALAWQGKRFEAGRGELINRVTPFRIEAVRAEVYRGPSWLDGRPCTILDYGRASLLAAPMRDEIRESEFGLWLGLAYVWRLRVLRFALAGEARERPSAT